MITAIAVSIAVTVCVIGVFVLWYVFKSRDIQQTQWKEIVTSVHSFRTQVKEADENIVEFVNVRHAPNFESSNPYAGTDELKIPSLLQLANIEDPTDPVAAAQFSMSDTYKAYKKAASKKRLESSGNSSPIVDGGSDSSIENPLYISGSVLSPFPSAMNMRSSMSMTDEEGTL